VTAIGDMTQELLSCLDLALQSGPNPPPDGNICLRVGTVSYDIGRAQDLCCEGFAWVRIVRVYPSERFPNQDREPHECSQSARAVEFEMGVVRCLPFGDADAGPSCDQWAEVFLQVEEDRASMARALCCFGDGLEAWQQFLENEWVPIDGQGGCIGGTTALVAQIDCDTCTDGGAA
jgi:hypothetical protein